MYRSPLHEKQNSYFEEEMAAMLAEGQPVDTHFCQWLVPIYLHSTFASNISTKNTSSKSCHVRSTDSVYISCRTSEQPHCFSNGVKRTLEASSGTIQDVKVSSRYFYKSLAFLSKVALLC